MSKIASKQKRIADIVLMLEKGMERRQILQKLSKVCKMSARTLDNEMKEAKAVLHSRNEQKEAIRQAQTKETLQQSINEAILSDLEIEAILCNIIKGNISCESMLGENVIIKGVTHSDIINASKVIYAKRGSNAPALVDVTTKGKALDGKKNSFITLPNGAVIDLG